MTASIRPHLVGAAAGLTFAIPLLGNLNGVPASALALCLPFAAVLLAVFDVDKTRRTSLFIGLLAALVYAALVVQSAAPSQFEFLTDPQKWLHHRGDYYGSKLMMFLIACGPSAFAALVLFCVRKPSDALTGFLLAFIAVACIAALRLVPYLHYLIRTDGPTATFFFDNSESFGFSTVSFGILFALASFAALSLPRSWPLAALFLTLCFLLNRKTETALITGAVLAFWFWHKAMRGRAARWKQPSAIFGTFFIAAMVLHNQTSLDTWRSLGANISQRTTLIDSAVSGETLIVPSIPSENADGSPETQADVPPRSRAMKFFLGRGLGWYSTLHGTYKYPHNIPLEHYLESGIVSATVFLIVSLASLTMVGWTAWQSHDDRYLALFLMLAAFFAIGMKAGEVTISARIYTFAIACAALTPLSARKITIRQDRQ